MYGNVLTMIQLGAMTINRTCYLIIKRVFDLCVSTRGLLLLIPIALIIKIATILTGDFTSIFYVQDRIGKDGKLFKFYKFRSMIPNADEELEKILKRNKKMREEYEKNKKLKNDPRITRVGKFIRKYSIDEMPQFINVFLGDMSLIGNRPYLPREKKDMGHYFGDIVSTKPGLTGYWQTAGRSDLSFHKRLKLEQEYSGRACLSMDLKIFFKTFIVVLFGRGA